MGTESKIVAVKFAKAPDRKLARQMLREIADRTATFTPRQVDKSLILYGAGDLGKMARKYFDLLGIPFLFVVDANPDGPRKDPFWAGIEIRRKDDVTVEQRASALLAICVATVPFTIISLPLIEQGWQDVVPFYDIAEAYTDRHPLSNGWHSGDLSEQDLCGIESVLSSWDDDTSRAHHLQFIAWRSLREEWLFEEAPVNTRDRYFIPQVLSVLHEHEVFVDVGAHHGQVIKRFLSAVENQYQDIFAFEPDLENMSALRNFLDTELESKNGRFHLMACALGSKSGQKHFFPGLGYISQIGEAGQAKVEVRCLDDFAIPATFIKIHIEGLESSMLRGGMETIEKNRPLLTVTSYHNRDGLWFLPTQIMSGLNDYAYYFRLHSWQDGCGVIYAIPRERLPKTNS